MSAKIKFFFVVSLKYIKNIITKMFINKLKRYTYFHTRPSFPIQ